MTDQMDSQGQTRRRFPPRKSKRMNRGMGADYPQSGRPDSLQSDTADSVGDSPAASPQFKPIHTSGDYPDQPHPRLSVERQPYSKTPTNAPRRPLPSSSTTPQRDETNRSAYPQTNAQSLPPADPQTMQGAAYDSSESNAFFTQSFEDSYQSRSEDPAEYIVPATPTSEEYSLPMDEHESLSEAPADTSSQNQGYVSKPDTMSVEPTEPVANEEYVERVPASKREIDSSVDSEASAASNTMTTTALRKEQSHVVARKKRQRKRKIITGIILVMVLAIIVVTAIAAVRILDLTSYLSPPADYTGKEPGSKKVEIEIPQGATGRDIGAILYQADVVASEEAFVEAFKRNSAAQSIQQGWYSLETKMKASEALAALLDDANKTDVGITILPGKTVAQVKEKFLQIDRFDKAQVDAAFSYLKALGLPAEAKENLEGWLKPDTYRIDPNMDAQQLLKQMLDANLHRLDDLKVPDKDRQAVLTKASIIEKEGKKEDFGKIARVIENRLEGKGEETLGKLQMDCTVTYGAGKGNSGPFMTREDKENDNPYNTYMHPGLPPTPIATVSDDAIKAVLDPPEGDWLFYVTVDLEKGTTKFATTQEEQDKNIEQLREYCRKNKEICGTKDN